MNNFLITGFGRCGTMFLSKQLGRSPQWEVRHEPYPREANPAPKVLEKIKARFRKDHYGEVNGILRHVFLEVPVKKRLVVIRHPHELLLSVCNRNYGFDQAIQSLAESLPVLDGYIASGVKFSRFEEFTRNKSEILKIAAYVGITDLTREQLDLNPLNQSRKRPFKTIDDLGEPVRIKEVLGPFVRKYYGT